jgi:putative membrane protein
MCVAARTLLALVLLVVAQITHAADAKLTNNDRHFIAEALEHGYGAIEVGRLAQQSASSPELKFLAQMLIDDHARLTSELAALAGKLGAKVPGEPGARQKGDYRKLARLSGDELDRELVSHIVREHEKAAALYEKHATRGDAEELKAFAARTRPMLEEHLRLARTQTGRK